MNTTKQNLTLGRALPLLALAPALFLAAYGAIGKANAENAPAPSASAPASASAAQGPKGPFYVLGKDIPAERSKKPSKDEWANQAEPVDLNRVNIKNCEALRVREWLRVTCMQAVGGSLVAGPKKDVELLTRGESFFSDSDMFRVVLTTPLVRGQSQIFSLLDVDFDYDSAGFGDYATLSIQWREGQENPSLALLAAD